MSIVCCFLTPSCRLFHHHINVPLRTGDGRAVQAPRHPLPARPSRHQRGTTNLPWLLKRFTAVSSAVETKYRVAKEVLCSSAVDVIQRRCRSPWFQKRYTAVVRWKQQGSSRAAKHTDLVTYVCQHWKSTHMSNLAPPSDSHDLLVVNEKGVLLPQDLRGLLPHPCGHRNGAHGKIHRVFHRPRSRLGRFFQGVGAKLTDCCFFCRRGFTSSSLTLLYRRR